MKIEVGESLILSYLKHVKKCVFYQTNWKISSNWETFNDEKVQCIYDYLNFYPFLTSKYNPDFSAWSSIRSSIEEVERAFESNINDYIKAVKTIGLLNIFSASGSILDLNFFIDYLKTACGVSDAKNIIKNLEAKNIIRYRSHSKRFILFEGTDLDIQTALIEAGNKISEVVDITTLLNNYLGVPLSGRAFRSNLLPFGTKGFPLQSLTQIAA